MIDLVSRRRCCNCARARECGSLQVTISQERSLVAKGTFLRVVQGRVGWGPCSLRESKFPSEGNRTPDPESFYPQDPEIFDPGIFPPGLKTFRGTRKILLLDPESTFPLP